MPTASTDRRWPIAAESIAVAAGAYLIAGVLELALIAVFQPTEIELTWVSDAILAGALGVVVYLWRHLRATRTELAAKERAQLVLDTQLAVAAELQRRLLPALPPPGAGLEWAADLRPAGRIGGDFYDLVQLPDGRWMVLVADVSGKGVPAAMALSTVRAAFRSMVAESDDPADVLTRLSASLFAQWGGEPYLTAVVVRVDAARGRLTYANAGHPAGLIAGHDSSQALEPLGPPAALLAEVRYSERDVALRPGDIAVFVSDGVTEGIGDEGAAALRQLITRLAHERSTARDVCLQVMRRAGEGTGPDGLTDWQDDKTVVALARDYAAAA